MSSLLSVEEQIGLDCSDCSVMHLLVIGFHPRSGYRVEFCTPPLETGVSSEEEERERVQRDIRLPEEWECLRYLALPDGAHKHDQDTIYFSMPSRNSSGREETVFGVSCYRQIHVTNRVGDGARGSIQKSVCILANKPLYALLESKLRWVTEAFFDQIQIALSNSDKQSEGCEKKPQEESQTPEYMLKICFDHIKLMLSSESSHHNGNISKNRSTSDLSGSENGSRDDLAKSTPPVKDNLLYEQIPLSQLISLHGASKFLMLFKVLLLEPRIVLFGPSALPIGQLMLSLCALFPEMLSSGLTNSHCSTFNISTNSNKDEDFVEISASNVQDSTEDPDCVPQFSIANVFCVGETCLPSEVISEGEVLMQGEVPDVLITPTEPEVVNPLRTSHTAPDLSSKIHDRVNQSPREDVPVEEADLLPKMINFATRGYPLSLYDEGRLWVPYASLHQLGELQTSRSAFSVGCTNALFVSNYGGLSCDLVVNVEESEIAFDWKNHDLKKLVGLTVEDIRFASELSNAAQSHSNSQGIDWYGGEQYLRLNFNLYLSALLLSVLSKDHKQMSCFYGPFCRSFEKLAVFKRWKNQVKSLENIEDILSMESMMHPGSSHGSMWNDMTKRWNHISSVSQRYKKVAQTKKAVTNAARHAFGNLFSKGHSKVNPTTVEDTS